MLRSIDREKCIGCGSCFKTCSFDVYRLNTRQEKTSPCAAVCPAGVDVRAYMHLLQQGRHADAACKLLEHNPIPLFTSRVCPHFCEKNCTRKKIDAPVNIPAMEDYLGRWILEHDPALPDISRAGTIAVIGSGAAGLSAAYFMRRRGYAVVVYEKSEIAGGQFRDSIPADLLAAQIEWFKRCGIEFRTNTPVGDAETVTVRGLRREHTKAVIIAAGRDAAAQFASVTDVVDGRIDADPVTLTTRTNGVFAAGPVRGASHDPAHEISDAREAVYSANCFVDGWDMLESRPCRKREIAVMPAEKMFRYSQELPVGNLPATPRNESSPGKVFNYETMTREANRCVTCGAKAEAAYKNDCMTCYFCEIACPVGAILIDPFKERLPRTIEFEHEGV